MAENKERWSRNIKLDPVEDKDVIEAAERLGTSLLFKQAVRYYLAREPYAVFPERVPPRHVEEAARATTADIAEKPKKKAKLTNL